MPSPLLFCNVGWMRDYRGLTDSDKILGGGSFVHVKGRGHEVCIFLPTNGKVYGFVQPVGSRIDLKRLGAPTLAEKLDGVDVVITALRPGGGTVVVGWYKDSTVYRNPQKIPKPTVVHKVNRLDTYRYVAKAKNARLLTPEQRTFIVPRQRKGFIGNSNVWYAEKAPKAWLSKVRRLLAEDKPTSRKKPKRSFSDPFKNAQVEHAAMSHVWSHYEKNEGYKLKDVSKENQGWDLEATSGALTLKIEVKGLSSKFAAIELTPNEYKAFAANSHDYRLCIVTTCLIKPSLSICAFNIASSQWAVEFGSRRRKVKVKERVAASITVT